MDRVKTHKELNETFLQDVTGNADPNTSDYLEIGDQDGIEVSMISQKPNPNDKSAFDADNSYIMTHATGRFVNPGG